MKNNGKKFEDEFKKSVLNLQGQGDLWYYRFRDGTAAWSGNNSTRFQSHNLCDCLVVTNRVFLFELKSHQGSSLPLSCIRKTQLSEMSLVDHKNIYPMFIINFREKEKTFAVGIKAINDFIENTDRKSIPMNWCEKNGLIIPQSKKRTSYTYDLEGLLY